MDLSVHGLLAAYRSERESVLDVIDGCLDRIAGGDGAIWVSLLSRERIQALVDRLESPGTQPLYGVPFAVKDNIDLLGCPTTAACPDYAYAPEANAPVVERLIRAGAIPIGKTNLDQFATGLVGTRSPYGTCRNGFGPDFIPGGSSAGSATALASGQVSFSLGTDTAGSGRVPAALQNLLGVKPTRGLVSTRGVVPACRSLDCVSLFALNAEDARLVLESMVGYDPEDPFSRVMRPGARRSQPPRFGVPAAGQLDFFGSDEYERLYATAIAQLDRMGWQPFEIDLAPFLEASRLLYEGPWLAERLAAIGSFLRSHPEALLLITREIIEDGAKASAVDAFEGLYRLHEIRRVVEQIMDPIDLLVLPTVGRCYTLAEVEADPLGTNARLGTYTNFVNLLDLCGVSVPAGFTTGGMPFGLSFLAPAFEDDLVLDLASVWMRRRNLHGKAGEIVRFAVCGAHMRGLPLNGQIEERAGRFIEATRTAPIYRMIALPGDPPRPGLIRQRDGGRSIELEIWEMPARHFGSFVDLIAPPLAMGTLELEGGQRVRGFVCEGYVEGEGRDVSQFGSWRRFVG